MSRIGLNNVIEMPTPSHPSQTYQRFLRWMIFLPEWMLSQVLKAVIGWV